MKNTKKNIPIYQLHPFENHPYKVQDNEEMERLTESIIRNRQMIQSSGSLMNLPPR